MNRERKWGYVWWAAMAKRWIQMLNWLRVCKCTFFFLSLLAPILCCIVLMQCGWWPMFNVGTRTFIQVRNSASILRLSSTWERITLDRNAPVNVAICRHWHWHMANRYSYFLCVWWGPRQRKRMSFEHVCMQLNFNYISQMKRNSSRCVQISHIVSKLVVASSKYWTYHRIGSMVMVQISHLIILPWCFVHHSIIAARKHEMLVS